MVYCDEPLEKSSLESQRWLEGSVSKARDDLKNRFSRDRCHGIQVSDDSSLTCLVKVIWSCDENDEIIKGLRQKAPFIR